MLMFLVFSCKTLSNWSVKFRYPTQADYRPHRYLVCSWNKMQTIKKCQNAFRQNTLVTQKDVVAWTKWTENIPLVSGRLIWISLSIYWNFIKSYEIHFLKFHPNQQAMFVVGLLYPKRYHIVSSVTYIVFWNEYSPTISLHVSYWLCSTI